MVDAKRYLERPLDESVSRLKFDEQLAAFRAHEKDYRARGCWLLASEFPTMDFAFVQPKFEPRTVVLATRIDFANYDLWPPSIQFIDAFTGSSVKPSQLGSRMRQARPPEELVQLQPGEEPFRRLIQASDDNDVPFLCVAGVREYHFHDAHSGDSWFMHRAMGKGTLAHLLNIILRYAIDPIKAPNFALQMRFNGYEGDIPS